MIGGDSSTSMIFGRLSPEAIPYHEPILPVTFIVVAIGGRCRRVDYPVQVVGVSVERMVHQRGPQEDRHHVCHSRIDHAFAWICRRDHDAHPTGNSV